MAELADALDAHDIGRAVRAVDWPAVAADVLLPAAQKLMHDLLVDSGEAAVAHLSDQLKRPPAYARKEYAASNVKTQIRFDGLNPRAVEWVKANAAKLVTQISKDQEASIRAVIRRGYEDGNTVERSAREISEIVGLTEPHQEYVEGLWSDLREQGVPESDIREQVNTETERLIDYRSEMIARHETIVAAYQGQREAWRQAADDLPPEAVQEWVDTEDTRTCPVCSDLDGTTAQLDMSFGQSDEGEDIYQPGDPHPQCRCGIVLRPWGKPDGEQRPGGQDDTGDQVDDTTDEGE